MYINKKTVYYNIYITGDLSISGYDGLIFTILLKLIFW